MTIGLVCEHCDALSPINVPACRVCGTSLGVVQRPESARMRPLPGPARSPSSPHHVAASDAPGAAGTATPAPAASAPNTPAAATPGLAGAAAFRSPAPTTTPASGARLPGVSGRAPATAPIAPLATQPPSAIVSIRNCPTCGEGMPVTHRFCGVCGTALHDGGAATPGAARAAGTMPFASASTARARLILIKGEGSDGVSYHLAGTEHVAGRSEGAILFPEDRLLSPRHANFFYRDGTLVVRDEGSRNGVYVRMRKAEFVEPDQPFMVGEQLLVARPAPGGGLAPPDREGTWFFGSPRRPARMHVVQLLAGGDIGLVVRCLAPVITIGREGNQVNFPDDPFISGHHVQVTALDDGRFQLEDLHSKNGTFVRVHGETQLAHGDLVFLGQQLLRVDIV